MHYLDGAKYEGEWKDGQISGEGKVIYPDDLPVYEGEWKEGKRHGEGKYTFPDGEELEGEWEEHEFTGD